MHCIYVFSVALHPNSELDLFIVEVSRSHTVG